VFVKIPPGKHLYLLLWVVVSWCCSPHRLLCCTQAPSVIPLVGVQVRPVHHWSLTAWVMRTAVVHLYGYCCFGRPEQQYGAMHG
jgi:hypothetical protein